MLDRLTLDPPRIAHLKRVETLRILAGIDEDAAGLPAELISAIRDARTELVALRSPTSPFSAMVNDYLDG
jgi:hypothetical protein